MEVKFTNKNCKTEEGIILWDLIDGEMVIDTRRWEKTHGFSDCINANADHYEYEILKTIVQNGGRATHQTLVNTLKLDPNLVDSWIERAHKKKLIIKRNNSYHIHLQTPLIDVKPTTLIAIPLVTKSYKHSEHTSRRYSPKQITRAAQAAFGEHFAIRNTQELFLPIYGITVENPDGSHHTTHWNGLNGKSISPSNLR